MMEVNADGTMNYDDSYIAYLLAGAAATILLFIINPNIMDRYIPGMKQVSFSKQLEFNLKLVALYFMITVCPMCIYAYLFEPELETDPIWYDSPLVRREIGLLAGHLIADVTICLIFYKQLGDISFIIHHLVTIYAYYNAMSYGALLFFANFRLMGEFSTPFLILKSLLDILGFNASNNVYLANGIIFTIAFFIFRILAMPVYWHRLYSIFVGRKDLIALGKLRFVPAVCCLALDFLNIIWFYRIFKGLLKALRRVPPKSHSS